MGKVVYSRGEFRVEEAKFRKRGHVIINSKGEYDNHSHIRKLGTCKMLLGLMEDKIVPDSDYLRESVLRLSLDEQYKQKIRNKIKKDKNRTWYHNPNKGIRRDNRIRQYRC